MEIPAASWQPRQMSNAAAAFVGFEFICAMACADGDGQRIDARPGHKFLNLVGLRIKDSSSEH